MPTGNKANGHALLSIPETPADFLPPKASSEVAEMKSLLRNPEHWAEIKPYLLALAGLVPLTTGSPRYEEARLVFKVQDICRLNGYTLLANLDEARISKVFKSATKGNTGLTIKMLAKQGRELRLEERAAAE